MWGAGVSPDHWPNWPSWTKRYRDWLTRIYNEVPVSHSASCNDAGSNFLSWEFLSSNS